MKKLSAALLTVSIENECVMMSGNIELYTPDKMKRLTNLVKLFSESNFQPCQEEIYVWIILNQIYQFQGNRWQSLN